MRFEFPNQAAADAAAIDLDNPVGDEEDMCAIQRIKLVVERHGGWMVPEPKMDKAD